MARVIYFFDYDHVVLPADCGGDEYYGLRCNAPWYGQCLIRKQGNGWLRKTKWRSNGSIRYVYFTDLDKALTSGIAWARRRVRKDEVIK